LIALMLSSQTKDTTNAIAMRRLQTALPAPGLSLETILDVDPIRLNELIYSVGFHNNKTRYIKATALILRDKYAGDIPDTIEGLTSLPGVGPKMGYLCLSAAWGRTEGIGVDVHVHRITNLWGWHQTKAPEETRLALQAWLPREKWHDINHLLVGFGQTICLPVGRDCRVCTLSDKGLCPSAVLSPSKPIKRVKKEGVERIKSEQVVVVKKEGLIKGIQEEFDCIKSEQVLLTKKEEDSATAE
jgi:endonuclease III